MQVARGLREGDVQRHEPEEETHGDHDENGRDRQHDGPPHIRRRKKKGVLGCRRPAGPVEEVTVGIMPRALLNQPRLRRPERRKGRPSHRASLPRERRVPASGIVVQATVEDHLDLDGAVEREDGPRPPRSARGRRLRRTPREEFARAVDEAGLPGEFGHGCHEPGELEDAGEVVDPADERGCRGDRVERALAGIGLRVSGGR